MKLLRSFVLPVGLAASLLCNCAVAAYLDFTDDSLGLSSIITGGYSGSIDGVGFTLTSDGTVTLNSDGGYDGSSTSPCQVGGGPLKCDKSGNRGDGVGIDNDEVSGLSDTLRQILTLEFETAVSISSIDFLDLYLNPDNSGAGEQANVTIDGGTPYTLDAIADSGDGGYARLVLGGLVIGKKIEFTAFQGINLQDDADNDYALAALTVSAVPVPAAAWLFGTALAGLIGFSRRSKAS